MNLLQLGTQPQWCVCDGYGFAGSLARDSRDEGFGDLEPKVGRRLRYLACGGTLGRD